MCAIAGIVYGHQREENELMTVSQNQTMKDHVPESPRKPYANPELTRHGTVVELTHAPIATDGAVGSVTDFSTRLD
jgi:hypothetical protein